MVLKSTVIAAAAAAIAHLVSAASAETLKLKGGVFVPPNSAYGWPFKRWVDRVNQQCADSLNIQIVGPEAISGFEQPQALQSGVLDIASLPPTFYQGIMIEGDAQTLAEIGATEQRKNGAFTYLNKLHEEKLNAHYLTFYGDGVKFYVYTTKPIKNGSLKGFRMRTVPIYQALFESMGASTATLQISAVYTALERGVVDGTGFPLWGVADFGWHKHLKYRYTPGFYNSTANILVNLDRWKSMSDQQRKCLDEAALWLEQNWPMWRDAFTKEEVAKQDKAGIRVVDLGPDFAKKAHALYWEKLKKASPEHIKRLKELITK